MHSLGSIDTADPCPSDAGVGVDGLQQNSVRPLITCIILGILILSDAVTASPRVIDLRKEPHTRILGAGRVAAGGDVNGDGIPDVLMMLGDRVTEPSRGRVWVLFGPLDQSRIDLEGSFDGFLIEGGSEQDLASNASAAGDVNADGLDDVVVGAPGADNSGRSTSGTAYVVFGKTDTESVDLALFDVGLQGTAGYRVDGPHRRALAGTDVAGLGDMNGDGRSEVAISAPFAGKVYVVFGKDDPFTVDLATMESGEDTGFVVSVPKPELDTGLTVGAAGDVNRDGVPDLVIGSIRRTHFTGSAYVIHTPSPTVAIDVRSGSRNYFRVKGTYGGSTTGWDVGPAGDMNGDGLDDVFVAAPAAYCCGPGAVYVVMGRESISHVDLDNPGRRVIQILGRGKASGSVGISVAGLGDVNGDGLDDVGIGAPGTDYHGLSSGSVFVVFGSTDPRTVRLDGSWHGRRIDGTYRFHGVGLSVAGPGDLDGDALSEVIAGAPGAYPEEERRRAHVVSSATL